MTLNNDSRRMLGRVLVAGSVGLAPSAAFAQQDPAMILGQLTSIAFFAEAVAYLLGAAVFLAGFYRLYKSSSDPRSVSVTSALSFIMSGILLLSLLGTISVLTRSTVDEGWSNDRLFLAIDSRALADFDSTASNTILGDLMPAALGAIVIGFVYLLGFIYFIKGLFMARTIGSSAQSGSAGGWKAFWHVIGGLCAMHIHRVGAIIANSFMVFS